MKNRDLRWSTFKESDFTGADLRGAKLTHERGEALDLSAQQRQVIDWQENERNRRAGSIVSGAPSRVSTQRKPFPLRTQHDAEPANAQLPTTSPSLLVRCYHSRGEYLD
jgi:Pentapeptide repeats (8 copies)